MVNYKAIGRRIAYYRKNIYMTQGTLSERLGVTESYISQIERGTAKVPLTRLSQISDVLGVDIALLVSDKASVSQKPVNTEIYEIIQDWPPDKVSLLVELLLCANDRIRKPR